MTGQTGRLSTVDISIERSLRGGPPDEPSYELRPLAFDTTATVRGAVHGGPLLGRWPRFGSERAAPSGPIALGIRRTGLAWAVVLLVLLAVVVAAALAAQWLPTPVANGKVAFLRFGGGYYPQSDIAVADPAQPQLATNVTRTSDLFEDTPRWSPDGQLLAFVSAPPQSFSPRPYTMPGDGRQIRMLADLSCFELAWLPDGDSVLCWSEDTVWELPLSGAVPRGLRVPGQFRLADVSADGTRLLLEPSWWPPRLTDVEQPVPGNLYSLHIETGELRQLTVDSDTFEGQAQWSPDGQLIAFSSQLEPGFGSWRSIEVVRADGTDRHSLVPPLANVAVRSPTWTPDGRQLLFESRSSEAGRLDGIWIVNADGTNQRVLVQDLTIAAAGRTSTGSGALLSDSAWSPDGQLLVVHDLQESRRTLYTITRNGSDLTELIDCLCQFDWQPLVGR